VSELKVAHPKDAASHWFLKGLNDGKQTKWILVSYDNGSSQEA
jgi:hypothetical protein